MFSINNLSLDQITLLYYAVRYTHIILTYLVVISLAIVLIRSKFWQLYFVVGIFLIQQCLLDGCFLSNFENSLGNPIGKEQIPNLFMLGIFENNTFLFYKDFIRLFLLMIGFAYCYLGYLIKKHINTKNILRS